MLQQGSGGAVQRLIVGLALPTCFLLCCFALGHLGALRLTPLAAQGAIASAQPPHHPQEHSSDGVSPAGDRMEASKTQERGRLENKQCSDVLAERSRDRTSRAPSEPQLPRVSRVVISRLSLWVRGAAEIAGYVLCAACAAWWAPQGSGGSAQVCAFVTVCLLATLGAVARWRLSALNSWLNPGVPLFRSARHNCTNTVQCVKEPVQCVHVPCKSP